MAVHVLGDCYLPITIIITFVYQLIVFFITFTLQVDTATDISGGSNVALLAILTLVLSQTYHTRQIIATTLQIVWGLRLGLFCLYRTLKAGHNDSRFNEIRQHFLKLFIFFFLQMSWVWSVSVPVSFINSEKIVEFADPNFGSVTDILGVILFVIGFLIESIADIHKLIFRINRSSSDEIIKTGLWAWSRHPNYFGDIVLWIGMYLLCLQSNIVNTAAIIVSLLCPLVIIVVLLFISGLPLSERPTHIKQFKAGNWPEYSKYLSRTSCLIPFPPTLYEPLPQIIKSTLFLEFPIYRFDPESEGDLVEKDKNVGDKNI